MKLTVGARFADFVADPAAAAAAPTASVEIERQNFFDKTFFIVYLEGSTVGDPSDDDIVLLVVVDDVAATVLFCLLMGIAIRSLAFTTVLVGRFHESCSILSFGGPLQFLPLDNYADFHGKGNAWRGISV